MRLKSKVKSNNDNDNLRQECFRLENKAAHVRRDIQEIRTRYEAVIADLRASQAKEEREAVLLSYDIETQMAEWRLRMDQAELG